MAALFDADDMAAFFDIDDGLGADLAVYTVAANGAVLSIPVLVDQPDVNARAADNVGASLPARIAYVRRSDLALPVRGDTIAANGELLTVQNKSMSADGLVWTLSLAVT